MGTNEKKRVIAKSITVAGGGLITVIALPVLVAVGATKAVIAWSEGIYEGCVEAFDYIDKEIF